jgi:hypothetical protein
MSPFDGTKSSESKISELFLNLFASCTDVLSVKVRGHTFLNKWNSFCVKECPLLNKQASRPRNMSGTRGLSRGATQIERIASKIPTDSFILMPVTSANGLTYSHLGAFLQPTPGCLSLTRSLKVLPVTIPSPCRGYKLLFPFPAFYNIQL